jgi:Ca2+-binding EF-hand superfamily protein
MIPSVAAFAASSASQLLSSLFSALDPTTSASSSLSSPAVFASSCSQPTAAASSNALTGSATPQLSGQILMTLMAMQQQGATGSLTAAASPASASASASSADPLQQLFSAMDTDGNGSVSQSEMESYIENAGGTQAQADSLFSALDQNGASGISEGQMSSAVQQAQSGGGHHHHHHHKVGGSSDPTDQMANTLLQAMDTDDDGAVSQSEFTGFVTANGGTAADAAGDFAALDGSGSGSLTSADFAKAWQNMQSQQTSQSSGSMVVSMLDAFAKAGASTSSTSTVSVSA